MAGLPHLLTRYYTVPSVGGAHLGGLVAVLRGTAVPERPRLAVLVKYEVMNNLVGSSFDQLPNWMAQWARVDAPLLSVEDMNGDGIAVWRDPLWRRPDHAGNARDRRPALRHFGPGGAGGLAAALSTADGLLLTISNALVRDLYFQQSRRKASPEQRVILTKFTLLSVALSAAFVAALKPPRSCPWSRPRSRLPHRPLCRPWCWASSGAAPRAEARWRACWRACRSPCTTCCPRWTGREVVPDMLFADGLWFGISPISSGVFGVPTGLLVTWLVSLVTRPGRVAVVIPDGL